MSALPYQKIGISLFYGSPLNVKLSDLLPQNVLIQSATIELSNKNFVRVTSTYIPKQVPENDTKS